MKSTIVYLAVPYSHPDQSVRERRFQAANVKAAKLMAEGRHVFSPISHSHVIALAHSLPVTWKFWRDQDMAVLRHCCALVVYQLDGWDRSVGVRAEIEAATSLGIPIEYHKE